MGHAARLRGDKVISEQLAREYAARRLVKIDRYDLQAIEGERDRLAIENARLTARLEKAMSHLRERRLTVTTERADRASEKAALEYRAHSAETAFLAYRRRWIWVSVLLRRCCSPATIREARELLKTDGED